MHVNTQKHIYLLDGSFLLLREVTSPRHSACSMCLQVQICIYTCVQMVAVGLSYSNTHCENSLILTYWESESAICIHQQCHPNQQQSTLNHLKLRKVSCAREPRIQSRGNLLRCGCENTTGVGTWIHLAVRKHDLFHGALSRGVINHLKHSAKA